MKRQSKNQDIYLKTFAILEAMKVEPDEKSFKQAFKFFWNGETFRYDSFRNVLEIWKENKMDEIRSTVKDQDIKRMKIALSDSYRTISKAAELSELDRSMVKRLVENGTINSVRVNNPHYSKSQPMTLIRMSELNAWMEENNRAVQTSRKTLEKVEKAKRTRADNKSKRLDTYSNAIEKSMLEFQEIAVTDPLPLLFLMLKLLDIYTKETPRLRYLYDMNLMNLLKYAKSENISFNHVIEVEQFDTVILCESCSLSASSFLLTAHMYVEKFGPCSRCITRKEILEKGKHYEVMFKRGDFVLLFRVPRSVIKKIEKNIPGKMRTMNNSISDRSGNFWDSIPIQALHLNIHEILDIMHSITVSLENRSI